MHIADTQMWKLIVPLENIFLYQIIKKLSRYEKETGQLYDYSISQTNWSSLHPDQDKNKIIKDALHYNQHTSLN